MLTDYFIFSILLQKHIKDRIFETGHLGLEFTIEHVGSTLNNILYYQQMKYELAEKPVKIKRYMLN